MTVRQQEPFGSEVTTDGKEPAFVCQMRVGKADNIFAQSVNHVILR